MGGSWPGATGNPDESLASRFQETCREPRLDRLSALSTCGQCGRGRPRVCLHTCARARGRLHRGRWRLQRAGQVTTRHLLTNTAVFSLTPQSRRAWTLCRVRDGHGAGGWRRLHAPTGFLGGAQLCQPWAWPHQLAEARLPAPQPHPAPGPMASPRQTPSTCWQHGRPRAGRLSSTRTGRRQQSRV